MEERMLNQLRLDPRISELCGRSVVVTGTARSGTTIIGKLLHSFQDVEYAFEPPMFFSLFPLLGKLDPDYWKFLYETYLYEEFLINALAGRTLNTRRRDDSSVHHVKPEALVKERLEGVSRKAELEDLARNATIAYKCPDICPFIQPLQGCYPRTRVVVMLREALPAFLSIKRKGWFRDETLRERNIVWPCRFVQGIRAPFWVAEHDVDEWVSMDEPHRIAYYYITMHEAMGNIQNALFISYEQLLVNPGDVARQLAGFLGLSWGVKTPDIISSVKPVVHPQIQEGMDGLRPDVLERVQHYSNLVALRAGGSSPLGPHGPERT